MYSRDPFNLRRNSPAANVFRASTTSLRESAAHATQRALSATETLFDAGRRALDSPKIGDTHVANMASYGLPNAGSTGEAWQSSGRSRFTHDADGSGGIKERVTDMFAPKNESLPMYKDKPAGHGGSRRQQPWFKQKRFIMTLLAGFALVSWYFGIFSPLAAASSKGSKTESKSQEKGWNLFGGKSATKWQDRAERVKDAFRISFSDYQKNGWGYDEYHPVSKGGRHMVPQGMGWIIVDALDTMMLMNLSTELTQAREWIHSNLTYDQDHDVNTFETTIRMLGGLLSAHYLSTKFPGVYAPVSDGLSDDMYVEKATDLADRLLGAYETQSGVPLASVNLHTMKGIPSHADGGASSTAEATSLQLEMKYLAKLTGETHYWEKAEHVMKVIDDNHPRDGLVPIFIYADQGNFRGDNIRLGSRGDSYYEYLIKQYLQTSAQEPVYQAMWNESMAGIKKHLITYSSPNNWTVMAEKPNGLDNKLSPKMDHLVCFMPGTIALATTGGIPLAQARKQSNWSEAQEEDIRLAQELMKTCMGMYKVTPTGLAPEIAHFRIHDPPLMYSDFAPKELPKSPESFTKCLNKPCTESESTGKDDFDIHNGDVHNLQRPETVESLLYMWRITGDEIYRTWGWEMFQSFIKWTAVDDGSGFSSASNVLHTPPGLRDNMESFWLAETLKYFYLLFASTDLLPLTDVVFNTEAHPFPRFEMGKLFKTGWARNQAAAGATGQEVPDLAKKADLGEGVTQTIVMTSTVLREVLAATVTMERPKMVTVTDDAAGLVAEATAGS